MVRPLRRSKAVVLVCVNRAGLAARYIADSVGLRKTHRADLTKEFLPIKFAAQNLRKYPAEYDAVTYHGAVKRQD